MTSRNAYLTYKRGTSLIVYWIIETSNAIIGRMDPKTLESDDDANDDDLQPQRRKQARPGKGKKGKRVKKPAKPSPDLRNLGNVPLEDYKIILDEQGLFTDYLMAAYDLVKEMGLLRSRLREVWREVAYDGLNSAIAGATACSAVAAIQRCQLDIFADFPDHDSFEAVANAITGGDAEKIQGQFVIEPFNKRPDPYCPPHKVPENTIDVKEQLFLHAYNDLVNFVIDFQHNRTGKPTKKMDAKIKNWNPTLDL
ncbi:hypothetical protein OQA88_13465 [Cercophora sp. LCS_1]